MTRQKPNWPVPGNPRTRRFSVLCPAALLLATAACLPSAETPIAEESPVRGVIRQYCVDCHNADKRKGNIDFDSLSADNVAADPAAWEKAVKKLRVRQMPPLGRDRPAEPVYNDVIARLAAALDRHAADHPNPGRTDTFRRLNRTEYQNAVRDLLALDIDAAALLPKDDASHGFDNVTVRDLSPTLLDRYISAAEKISRLAIGRPPRTQGGDTIRIRPDLTQEEHVEGLPVGTRGGALIPHTFPQDADYEIHLRLSRDRNEEIEGLHGTHEMEVLLDGGRVTLFTVAPPAHKNYDEVDRQLKLRTHITAGPHQLGVTFLKDPSHLLETKRQPYAAHYNMHRHPRITPAVYQVSINGPYDSSGPGDTPSRRRIFVRQPAGPDDEEPCARAIIATLMRRAYRRPVGDDDLAKPMQFFRSARAQDGFEAGIERALSAILVSPHFLFRVESNPAGVASNAVYRLGDLELASRLSFFLWSSIPDDELLGCAARGELHQRPVLAQQARRMLADPRSRSLVSNFAGQWLHLRNLEGITPDLRLFPDFDHNLREAFQEETELLFDSVVREDRSVLALLKSDYTFLNERLAKHYGIPAIYGSRFRRVSLAPGSERGGLLRQGSILTVTSYATRTSPVLRGQWVLANLLGAPPPPPPGNVPALKENTVSDALPMRARLAAHRADAACASCHNLMDPLGFSLENFDAVGRWRAFEDGEAVDARGGFADGSEFSGVAGLEEALLKHPDLFASALAEKLLVFALGRGIEPYDAPAVRQVVRTAQANEFRFSSLVEGIVTSTPFTMRRTP